MDEKKHDGGGGGYGDDLLEEETKKESEGSYHEISNFPTEILEHLFEFLPFNDLTKCRLVNSEWCKAVAVPARKRLKQLIFVDTDVFATHGVADLQKFIDCVNSTDSFGVEYFPVGRFHLHLASTIRSVFPGKPVLDTFFKTISGIARQISLDFSLGWNYLSDEDLPRIHNYPQLKYLQLTILSDECSKDSGPQYRKIFQFIRNMLEKRNAPNLEKISVGFGSGIFELETIPMCINEIGSLKMLIRMELQTLFNKVDWATLSSLGLELKILRIPFGACEVDTEMFKRFLESQAGTLRSLEIFYQAQWTTRSVSIELPRLEKLERFFLQVNRGFVDQFGEILFPNIFQRGDQFPSLKKLTLDGQISSATFNCFLKNENGLAIDPMDTVEELSLPNSFKDGSDMQKFAKLFPSIKKLGVGAHVKVLRSVYEEIPDLEELTLETSTENIDVAVTGLSRQMCQLIGELGIKDVFNNEADSSMTCLQKLKVLTLENRCWRWHGELEFQIAPVIWKTLMSLRCLDLGLRKFPFQERDSQLLDDLRQSIYVIHRSPPIYRSDETETEDETDDYSDSSNFSSSSISEESESEYFSNSDDLRSASACRNDDDDE